MLAALIVMSLLFCVSLYAHVSCSSTSYTASVSAEAMPSSTAAVTAAKAPAVTQAPSEIYTDSSIIKLVNPTHSVSKSYVPDDLTSPNVTRTQSDITLRKEASDALEEMFAAAENDGVTLVLSDGYRSYTEQEQTFNSYVARLGEAKALKVCAKAGYSEHELGLAADITADESTAYSSSFDSTAQGQWLKEHAHEYGFLQRVPEGKSSIVGYSSLPWHYRYVGVDLATAVYSVSPDETLEEYWGLY